MATRATTSAGGRSPRVVMLVAAAVGVVLWTPRAGLGQEGGLRFYAPLDEHTRGVLLPTRVGIDAAGDFVQAPGVVGGAARPDPALGFQYPLGPLLSQEEGSVAVWVKVNWDPAETATRMVINLGKLGCLRRWESQRYLTYTLWYHHLDEKHDYGCTWSLEGWGPGQWRHLVVTWSWSQHRRVLYVDGKKVVEAPIERLPNAITTLQIGPDAEAADELAVYSTAVDEAEVARLHAAGQAGRAAFELGEVPAARGAIQRLPEVSPALPASFVTWSLDGAEQRDNGLRGEVTLHGWWRWQRGTSPYDPPDPSGWLYRKVPAHSHYGESFPVRDEAFEVVGAGDPRVGQQTLNELPQWCEREFVPPAEWRGRQVMLTCDSLVYESAIFLNGELLEALPRVNLGGEYDVTDRLRWDTPNRLTLFSSGVDGDIWLVSRPEDVAIEDAWMVTSWREKKVTARVRVRAARSDRVTVRVEVLDARGTRPVKSFSTSPSLEPGGNEIAVDEPWANPTPWSLTEPYLYRYQVSLLGPDGDVLDATWPTAFGFREVWVQGGDIYLNGYPVHFIGHSNAHLTAGSEVGDPEYIRYSLRQWRKAGLNAVTPWQGPGRYPTYDRLLDAADELGFAIFPVVHLPTGEYEAETPAIRAYWETLLRCYIERYRQHPSVLGWMIGSGSHNYDFCPGAMDGQHPADVPKAEPLRKTWAYAGTVDSTRLVFGLSNGDLGPIWTSMAYLGHDVDLQERENWPLLWSKTRHKPLMPCEFSLPYYRDWFARPSTRAGRDQYSPANTQSLATEYGAMYLGPSVYAAEPEKYLATLQQSPGAPTLSEAFWQTKLLFADTLRAWRAWGLSFVYHAEVPGLFTGSAPTFPSVAELDPRRAGCTPETLAGSLQAADELSEFGARVRDATAPCIAFLGGPDGRFTLKDHAYWSGERVRKALVLVSDRRTPTRGTALWDVVYAGGRSALGPQRGLAFRIGPGERDTSGTVLEFIAPAVRQRTDLALVASCKSDPPPTVGPAFAITVFPADRPEGLPNDGLVLFDPVGDTRDALGRLGVQASALPQRLGPEHRLVVGRHALEEEGNRLALGRAGFDEAVAAGMRALVFEQAAPEWEGTLMGLRMKRLATRRAFVRVPGHPVLEGLAESDFHHLRGDSDVIEAYPGPGPMPDTYPEHFWHWGNDNIVATYTLEKPQVGAAWALLDCGFDLVETPLLEVARGQGLLLFCQVDVTNRVGEDPVSTRLVASLLRYLVQGEARPPAGASLEQLAAAHRATASVEGYLSPPPDLPGVHAGELFFREKLKLPAFDPGAPAPLFTRVQAEARQYWLTSLSAASLASPWQRAKRARIEAALRMLNGERPAVGPSLAAHGDRETLYPHNWQRLPKWEQDFDPYVYWRW